MVFLNDFDSKALLIDAHLLRSRLFMLIVCELDLVDKFFRASFLRFELFTLLQLYFLSFNVIKLSLMFFQSFFVVLDEHELILDKSFDYFPIVRYYSVLVYLHMF